MNISATAYLVCIYGPDGKLTKRRIAFTESDAIDFVNAYVWKLDASVIEDRYGRSGKIVKNTTYFGAYDIANITVI